MQRSIRAPGARRNAFRAPGIARRERLLAAARSLLDRYDLDELSLADVATLARIPKGSAYHYYRDITDLYEHLVLLIEEEMFTDQKRALPRRDYASWAEVVEVMVRRGARLFARDAAARRLLIGPKTPPQLKLRDRQNDVRIGKSFEEQIAARFVLPERAARLKIFFRSVEIADLMFCLSVLEHGTITREMTDEAVRATVAYLRSHFPEGMPRREQALRA